MADVIRHLMQVANEWAAETNDQDIGRSDRLEIELRRVESIIEADVAATLERAGETPEDARRMAREAVAGVGALCCGRTMAVGYRCEGCQHAKPGDKLVPRRQDISTSESE